MEEKNNVSFSNIKLMKQYARIENDVEIAENIQELSRMHEIKLLDPESRLKELKLDKIRVILFLDDNDTFVYLGTFYKKSGKTPPNEIIKNNNRISEYLKQRNKEKENGKREQLN